MLKQNNRFEKELRSGAEITLLAQKKLIVLLNVREFEYLGNLIGDEMGNGIWK
jgi:hypothetical protein